MNDNALDISGDPVSLPRPTYEEWLLDSIKRNRQEIAKLELLLERVRAHGLADKPHNWLDVYPF